MPNRLYTLRVAMIVALGGFLMGFDASVIAGVVGFIEDEFALSKLELGWSVSSLTLTATLAMMFAGPLSDRYGRRAVLRVAALLFAVSAVASAVAPDFLTLVLARMLGGFGVGAALIVAPMYIAEMAPAEQRGRLVSFNQLNIVIGISAAFFSNYMILQLASSTAPWAIGLQFDVWAWRWMLGVETLPALIYFVALFGVPESPRWLTLKGRDDGARQVLDKVFGQANGEAALGDIRASLDADAQEPAVRELFTPAMRQVIVIGVVIGVLQQITGINAVFFYAPMIFEQTGVGTDAAFAQAVLVGLTNLAFTVAAMVMIDRLGRRRLLLTGLTGIVVCMFALSYSFALASYRLDANAISAMPADLDRERIAEIANRTFESDLAFRGAAIDSVGADAFAKHEQTLVSAAIDVNSTLILVAILGFVASFAMSVGPVMWVLFSELFPNRLRGLAISFVGLINSAVSFLVTLLFPWELASLGSATTFAIYAGFALAGLVFVARRLPETKQRTLEEIEAWLVGTRSDQAAEAR